MTDPDPSERILFSDVTVRRERTTILRNLDWRVGAGENWAVIGPNGSGKSTLLRILGGELFPSAGTVRVLGHTYGRVRIQQVRRRIGWVSAGLDARLAGRQSALDVVLTGATGGYRLFEPPGRAAGGLARDQLARVRMDGLADRPYEVLSSGERQRVMLARALLAGPDLLALDEPCAGLDLAGRELLLSALVELAAEPDAPEMVFVTHHVEELFPGISHALLLKEGRVIVGGEIAHALTDGTLTNTFDLPVTLSRENGRFTARAGSERGQG